MSEHWEPGDLALCVRGPTEPDDPCFSGRVYTVSGVRTCWFNHSTVLHLHEVPNEGDGWLGHYATQFRKVTPPKADEFDRETIELYTRKPVDA